MPDDNTSTPEPVLTSYLVSIVLAVAAAFGVDASNELVGQAAAAIAGLIAIGVTAWVTRSKVTPVAKADVQQADAYVLGISQGAANAERAAAESARPSLSEFGGTLAPAEPAKPTVNVNLDPDVIFQAVQDFGRAEPIAPPPPPAPPAGSWERPPMGEL